MKTVNARSADAHDQRIGQLLKIKRLEMGLSQTDIANEVGITFQQIQKYERGANRIAAGRLQELSKALGISTDYFFSNHHSVSGESEIFDLIRKENAVKLLRAYSRLSGKDRATLLDVAEVMAKK